ncbi:MAG: alanine racemase [Bryobacteraceae bacterium]
MSSPPFRSWVEVSRKQISENLHAVRSVVGSGIEVMPVVKADAYRHGAVEVSRVLEGEGCRWLAVSNVEEGVCLRAANLQSRILVMADFLPGGRDALVDHQLTPVIHSLEDLGELNRLARKRQTLIRYHLKVDTGMGRLGTRAAAGAIANAIRDCENVSLEGLMTHFASVADFNSSQTDEQTRCFLRLCARLRDAGIAPPLLHMSSTGAIAYGRKEAWGNLVRPGHAIYGYTSPARGPAPPNSLRVEPALTWKASVLTVKDLEAGALIGYGGMFRASKPTRIAVLGVGYADGLPHRLSNKGRVIAGGKVLPILGAVSMDLTTIDVTECPEIKPGDSVTLLGRCGSAKIDAQEIARIAGTISYSVLCGISSRVKRVYTA